VKIAVELILVCGRHKGYSEHGQCLCYIRNIYITGTLYSSLLLWLYSRTAGLIGTCSILGWQSRWFVLDGGVLSYYLSAEDVRMGCRGSVRMASCALRGE